MKQAGSESGSEIIPKAGSGSEKKIISDPQHWLKVNQWIDGHRFDKDFVIDDRYYRSKRKNL